MRAGLILLAATVLAAQQDRPYTFGTTVVSTSGLQGRIFYLNDKARKLPRFEKMKSVGTIYTNRLDIFPRQFSEGFPGITDRFEWFAIDYTGRFWVEEPGQYGFSLMSDDGARLRIDNKELIDNDGIHPAVTLTGSAFLSRGIHTIRVSYFQGPRVYVALMLAVAPPGKDLRVFNTDEFLPPKDSSQWVNGTISDVRRSVNRDR